MLIEHQEHAGESKHEEQIEGDAPHSPGVAVAHRVTVDLGRGQMQENVGEHAEGTVARGIVMLVAEDGSVDLGLRGFLEDFGLLFRFCRQVGFATREIFLKSSCYALVQANYLA